jgi:hypothetical protein
VLAGLVMNLLGVMKTNHNSWESELDGGELWALTFGRFAPS